MVIKTDTCFFTELKIFPGHGKRIVRKDGKVNIVFESVFRLLNGSVRCEESQIVSFLGWLHRCVCLVSHKFVPSSVSKQTRCNVKNRCLLCSYCRQKIISCSRSSIERAAPCFCRRSAPS